MKKCAVSFSPGQTEVRRATALALACALAELPSHALLGGGSAGLSLALSAGFGGLNAVGGGGGGGDAVVDALVRWASDAANRDPDAECRQCARIVLRSLVQPASALSVI